MKAHLFRLSFALSLCLAFAGGLHAQTTPIKNPKLSGAGHLRPAATLTVESTAEVVVQSGGALTLEAGAVFTAADPISLANGGLGVALADPGADRLLFWDDSAGAVAWLTLGTGLSTSGTTLNGFASPMTTAGDIIIGGTAGAATRLAVGTDGQVLKVVSGAPAWAAETGSGGAPDDATYIVQIANGDLPNAQAMGALGTGIVKNTTTTGVQSIAVAGTDYVAPGAVTTSGIQMNTARLLGRTTASAGAVEEITVGSGLSLSAGALTATGGGGSGDVTGPGSSTDNALVRWNGTAGTAVQDSNVTLADSGTALVFSGAAGLTAGGSNQSITLTPTGTGEVVMSLPTTTTARAYVTGAAADYAQLNVGRSATRYATLQWDNVVGEGGFSTYANSFPFTFDGSYSRFRPGGTERVRFSAAGNVLVGSTSDSGLSGAGNIRATAVIEGASFRQGGSGPTWTSGSGSPEGAVTAPVGSLFSRTDGGAGTTLYVKESGSGNTGWAAK